MTRGLATRAVRVSRGRGWWVVSYGRMGPLSSNNILQPMKLITDADLCGAWERPAARDRLSDQRRSDKERLRLGHCDDGCDTEGGEAPIGNADQPGRRHATWLNADVTEIQGSEEEKGETGAHEPDTVGRPGAENPPGSTTVYQGQERKDSGCHAMDSPGAIVNAVRHEGSGPRELVIRLLEEDSILLGSPASADRERSQTSRRHSSLQPWAEVPFRNRCTLA